MAIVDERYVSFTTFRRNGAAVATPVWVAPLPDGRAGFTTDADAGKVKRLRNDARIELRPCDVRGRVADGAPVVTGTATVAADGPDRRAVDQAMQAKYGIQFRLVHLGGALKRVVTRGPGPAAVVIDLADPTD